MTCQRTEHKIDSGSSFSSRIALGLSTLTCAVLLAACGGGKEGGATQVAAKVNKEELSVHQINHVLQRQPGIKPEMVPAASKRILEGLIDQELAIQQAVELKVDRDPKVVTAIEAARRDIIARAYADRVAESAAKPTPEEVKAYYSGKPALFAQRRIYSLAEFAIEAPADQREALAGKLQGVKSPSDLAAALNAAGIKFASRNVTQAPENLPLPMVDKIAAMGEGQSFTVGTPAGLTLVFVTAAKPAPVTEDAARPAIEQFLLNDRKRKLVADEIKRLRDVAKIEYKGQFANAPAGAASGVEAPAVAPTPAASQ
jgi:EpsD family peptidyl-prolyl cis-trans isomerase